MYKEQESKKKLKRLPFQIYIMVNEMDSNIPHGKVVRSSGEKYYFGCFYFSKVGTQLYFVRTVLNKKNNSKGKKRKRGFFFIW